MRVLFEVRGGGGSGFDKIFLGFTPVAVPGPVSVSTCFEIFSDEFTVAR